MKGLLLGALIGASFLTFPTVQPRVDSFWRTASCQFAGNLFPWCPLNIPPTPPKLQPIVDPNCACSDLCLGPCS